MTDNRKTTVPGASVGADAVQSSDKITTNIITNSDKQINLQAAKKSNNFGLNTISMTELYDTVYAQYKTAPTEEQREQARQEYLDRRGVPESFRW